MIDVIKDALTEWGNKTDSREKLQHAYVAAAIVLTIAAGILGLINYNLGQQVLFVAILSIGMFFVNSIAWALLQSFILLKLGASRVVRAPSSTKKSSKKK